MNINQVENIKDAVLSYLRNSSYRDQAEDYLLNAVDYMERGSEYGAIQQLKCCANYLEKGGSDERKMAQKIYDSI